MTASYWIPCRFGCVDEPAAYLIEFGEGGCVCFPDRIQALCLQHAQTTEPLTSSKILARLTADGIELVRD